MNINSIGNIPKIITKATDTIGFTKLPDLPNDVFVKSTEAIDESASKIEDALKKAFEFCKKSVSKENPVESQMAFDSSGKILYTNIGDEKTCKLEYDKLTQNSTAIHSHPDACTLSIEDVMVLVTKPNLKKIGSIDPQGRTCIMEKPEGYATPSQKEIRDLYHSFNTMLKNHWTSALGVPENAEQICLEENEKRLMEAFGFNSVQELYKNFGIQKTGIFEQDLGNIGWLFCLPEAINKGYSTTPLGKYDPEWGAVSLNIEKIKARPEGIEIGNQLLQTIAKTLGFKFESGQI